MEAENLRLRVELEAEKALTKTRRGVGKFVASSTTRVLAGKGLKNSVRQLLDEIPEGKVSKDTLSELGSHIIWRLTRIGTFAVMVTIVPMLIMVIQTWMLSRQNDKLEDQNSLLGKQNKRLDQQINLEEGNRRSSLILFMSNIMDRMDDELRSSPSRSLSESLVGRIVSLSQGLRPYRYLENDSLTVRQLSPERGQLLFSLINSNLDKGTYDRIFSRANFNFADLREANFSGAYMRGAHLAFSSFSEANFNNANLENANLTGAYLERATFRNTLMNGINLSGANLDSSQMVNIVLQNGNLENADLRSIYLRGDFSGSNLEGINVANATMIDVELEGCYFKSLNWIENLESQNVKGLRFVRDIYEPKQEIRQQGFAADTVFTLRSDPLSMLARMRKCSKVVERIVASAPAVQKTMKEAQKGGEPLTLYSSRNPYGMEELGIVKDSVWLYRLSSDEQDLANVKMWVQFNPRLLTLWRLFPEAEKKPEELPFEKGLLKKMEVECSAH